MLTPVVTALIFTNVMAACALSWIVVLNAAGCNFKKSFARPLTDDEPTPTRFAGRAGGSGRPSDIVGLSKEEFHELPSAA
jgi:hypothetical protein